MNFLDKLTKGVEVILIGMFGIMAVLVFGNVVLRYGFNSGIVFSEEVLGRRWESAGSPHRECR